MREAVEAARLEAAGAGLREVSERLLAPGSACQDEVAAHREALRTHVFAREQALLTERCDSRVLAVQEGLQGEIRALMEQLGAAREEAKLGREVLQAELRRELADALSQERQDRHVLREQLQQAEFARTKAMAEAEAAVLRS